MVFLLTFFLNFFNTYTGMRQMDHEYVDLASLMGVKGWKSSFKVIFPAISPIHRHSNQHSLRPQSAPSANSSPPPKASDFLFACQREYLKTADVFVGIIVPTIMVIVLDKIAEAVERRALRWQTQTGNIFKSKHRREETSQWLADQDYLSGSSLWRVSYSSRRRFPGEGSTERITGDDPSVPNFAFAAIWVAEQLKYF